jgi:hypothetical protein
LDFTAKWSSAIYRVVALFCYQIYCGIVEGHNYPDVFHAVLHNIKHFAANLFDVIFAQLVEHDRFIYPVEELRFEQTLYFIHNRFLNLLVLTVVGIAVACFEAKLCTTVCYISGTSV